MRINKNGSIKLKNMSVITVRHFTTQTDAKFIEYTLNDEINDPWFNYPYSDYNNVHNIFDNSLNGIETLYIY